MHGLARWCVTHRLAVIGGWLAVLAVSVAIGASTGSDYKAGDTLAGTQSATAQSLLQKASPAAAGDSEQIVFSTRGEPVTAPAVAHQIKPMLERVSRLPNVASVSSPYARAGADQISKSGTIAFATVRFTKQSSSISTPESRRFVRVARAASSRRLQIDVVGEVAGDTNPSSSDGTLIGLGAALVILLLVFGSLLPALAPLVSTGIALISAISIVGALSTAVSMASFTEQLSVLIGLGVGIDYSLFILARIRTGLREGLPITDAVAQASATAGRAVVFAGITVCIALCGMLVLGVSILDGAAIAASVSVIFSILAAQTLLPALAGVLGSRVMTRKQRAAVAAGETNPAEASRRWARWSELVQTHRLILGTVSVAIMLGLAAPAIALREGTADFGTDPTTTTTTTYRAYETITHGFGAGATGPLELVAPIRSRQERAAFGRVVSAVRRTRGVAKVTSVQRLAVGPGHPAVAVADAYPIGSPQAASTSDLIGHLRDTVIPHATRGTGAKVLVGGQTALADDQATQLASKLPVFIGTVVALSFLLLLIVFRSLLIPVTAALMNMLSAGAAFGVITAVFQDGFLDTLVGVSRTGPVSPLVPILMFAVLFGLSMDYEVFLVSRMHEEWHRGSENHPAVRRGQAVSGKTIMSLATIMVCVFLAFVLESDLTIKMIGLGMATAIAVDALLVRAVLVPAIMHALGKLNWALPRWLDHRLPHVNVDGEEAPPQPKRVPVAV